MDPSEATGDLRVPAFARLPVRLDVTYTQLYYENPRQRNHRERQVTEAVALQVPVLDADEAPVLLTGPYFLHTGLYRVSSNEVPEVTYRDHDGQVYCEVLSADVNAMRPTVWTRRPIGAYIEQHLFHFLDPQDRRARTAAEIQATLQSRIDSHGYLLIDGQMYEPCGEPVYRVQVRSSGAFAGTPYRSVVISEAMLGEGGDAGSQPGTLFRADQLGAALAHARTLCIGDAIPREPAMPYTVHRPERLRCGRPLSFTAEVTVTLRVQVPVDAEDQDQAIRLAEQHLQDLYGPNGLWRVHTGETLIVPADRPAGHLRLNCPGIDLHFSGNHLHLTLEGDHADLELHVPDHARLPVLAAAALLAHADQGVPVPAHARLAPLAHLTLEQADQLASLLGAFPLRLAQRATRGRLPDAALGHLLGEIDRICTGSVPLMPGALTLTPAPA